MNQVGQVGNTYPIYQCTSVCFNAHSRATGHQPVANQRGAKGDVILSMQWPQDGSSRGQMGINGRICPISLRIGASNDILANQIIMYIK